MIHWRATIYDTNVALASTTYYIINSAVLSIAIINRDYPPPPTDDLKQDFDMYIKTIEDQNPGLLMTRVRHSEQLGLTTARISGWKAATADVVAILDAHIEVHDQW